MFDYLRSARQCLRRNLPQRSGRASIDFANCRTNQAASAYRLRVGWGLPLTVPGLSADAASIRAASGIPIYGRDLRSRSGSVHRLNAGGAGGKSRIQCSLVASQSAQRCGGHL
jgi:hypothetical protein